MAQIIQGDQYIFPVKIRQDGVVITSSDVQDVRIQVGDVLKTYSSGEITYNSTDSTWEYPLTQEQTFLLEGISTKVQVGIKVASGIIYSSSTTIMLGENIITKEW